MNKQEVEVKFKLTMKMYDNYIKAGITPKGATQRCVLFAITGEKENTNKAKKRD